MLLYFFVLSRKALFKSLLALASVGLVNEKWVKKKKALRHKRNPILPPNVSISNEI